MLIAEIVAGIVAYLMFGYTLGWLSNRMYRDETPSDKLGLFGKLGRFLLFPISYFQWERREEAYRDVANGDGPPILLRGLVDAYNTEDTSGDERYCGWSALLWPLRSIALLIGFAILAYYSAVFPMRKVLRGMEHVLDSVSRNRDSHVSGSITTMEQFLTENIDARAAELYRLAKQAEERAQHAQKQSEQAQKTMRANSENEPVRIRCESLIARFLRKVEEYDKKRAGTLALREQILERANEMRTLIELLQLQTDPILNDTESTAQAKETLDAALAAMRACQKLFHSIGNLEVSTMNGGGEPINAVAERMVQNGTREEELFREEIRLAVDKEHPRQRAIA